MTSCNVISFSGQGGERLSHGVAHGGYNCCAVGTRYPKSHGIVLQAQMEEMLASVERPAWQGHFLGGCR